MDVVGILWSTLFKKDCHLYTKSFVMNVEEYSPCKSCQKTRQIGVNLSADIMYLEISVSSSSVSLAFMVTTMLTQLLTLLDYETENDSPRFLPHKILKFMLLKSINNIESNYSSGRKEQICFFSLCDCLHIKKRLWNCCRCATDKCLPLSNKIPCIPSSFGSCLTVWILSIS